MKKNTHVTIAILISSLALVACHPKPVAAPRSDVQASSDGSGERVAKYFPRADLRFAKGGATGGARFFLWKLKSEAECPARASIPVPGSQNPGGPRRPEFGACPKDIAFVLDTSKEFNRSDDNKFIIQGELRVVRTNVFAAGIPNAAGTGTLDADQIVKLLDGVATTTSDRDRVSAQQEQVKRDRAAKKAQLDSELAKPETEQDRVLIDRLTREIATLDTRIAGLQRTIDRLNVQIADATRVRTLVGAAGLDDDLARFRELDVLSKQIAATCTALTQEIDKTVDLYVYSDNLSVEFRFPVDGIEQELRKPLQSQDFEKIKRLKSLAAQHGPILVEIKGWDLRFAGSTDVPEGEREFSTADGTITNVTYVEQGGTFEFDVHAEDGRYHFKISRSRYRSTDGRAHVQGDIIRYGKDDKDPANPRRGVAVLDEES